MLGRTAKTALKTRTGRQASKSMARGMLKAGSSKGGKGATKSGTRGLVRLMKTGAKVKAGKEAGKAGTKGAVKAGRGFGKLAAKKGKREFRMAEKTLKSERSGGGRFFKYGLLALAGFGIVALLVRFGNQGSSTATDTSGPGQAGSGTSAGDDADRAKSDPSSGPLIGESHQENIEGVTEDQPELAQRIKTRIGEDERTRDMPRVNVEVNGGVAELRGGAPSEEAKAAAGEIAADTEGISEVRNLIEVSS